MINHVFGSKRVGWNGIISNRCLNNLFRLNQVAYVLPLSHYAISYMRILFLLVLHCVSILFLTLASLLCMLTQCLVCPFWASIETRRSDTATSVEGEPALYLDIKGSFKVTKTQFLFSWEYTLIKTYLMNIRIHCQVCSTRCHQIRHAAPLINFRHP